MYNDAWRTQNNTWLMLEYTRCYNFWDRLKFLFTGRLNFDSLPLYNKRGLLK